MANLVDPSDSGKPIRLAETELGTKLKKFTIEDVDLILTVLAMNGSNYAKTARQVGEELGISIHQVTLQKWANQAFPTRFAEIQHNLGDKIDRFVTAKISGLTLRSAEVQENLLDALASRLEAGEELPIKDLGNTIRNIAQTQDLSLKQKRLLEDRPTQIQEVRTIDQAVQELEAEEIIVDADVIDEEGEPGSLDLQE